jgi:acyl-CoA synthetase (AMP-forming)/AMP-acid ligase II
MEVTSYQFLHDSVQCFLAALEMNECTVEEQLQILKNCIKSLFTVYEHSFDHEEDDYLGHHMYKQQYSEEMESSQKYEPKLSEPQPLLLQFFAGTTGLKNPAVASTLIEESRKGSHDQWCKSALPLILYESQNKELIKDIMREVLQPQIVVSCQDNFYLRFTAWCMAQAETKVEELTIILREHICLQLFCDTSNDLSHLKTLTIWG